MTKYFDKIAKEEGFRSKPYKCTGGALTIGYGINLEAKEIPEEIAKAWAELIIKDIVDYLEHGSWFRGLNNARKVAIADMVYQLGIGGFKGFRNTIRHLRQKDYEAAADEMLNSKWAKQTPERAKRNSEIIRTGVIK